MSKNNLSIIQKIASDKRIVFISGNFNILHPGHLRLIRFARECGDFLVVGVINSLANGAYVSEKIRLESVLAISWIDYAFILNESPAEFIGKLKPSIVVKGSEHEFAINPEKEIVAEYGGQLLFSSGDASFSSIDFIQKEWQKTNFSSIKKPQDYLLRHDIEKPQLLKILKRMKNLNVCVVGDVIVDEYITCDALGMSQEDPTIVVTPVMQKKFIGGAGIVAAHANSLGNKVNFFSVTGRDENTDFVNLKLRDYGVDFFNYNDSSRPTTLKQRFRASDKTLLRVNHLRQHDINEEIRFEMLNDISTVLENTDLLIFSDFNYGCLPQILISEIVKECRKRKIMMAADSQSSSQLGDVSRFHYTSLITPTEREARLALQDFDSGLVVLAEKLKTKTNASNVLLTLGEEGVLIHADLNERNQWPTDRLTALNPMPKDVAGAGDSLLIGTAMALATGAHIWQAAYLGALAAACQIGRVGNIPLIKDELVTEIFKLNI